eukprot:937866_1
MDRDLSSASKPKCSLRLSGSLSDRHMPALREGVAVLPALSSKVPRPPTGVSLLRTHSDLQFLPKGITDRNILQDPRPHADMTRVDSYVFERASDQLGNATPASLLDALSASGLQLDDPRIKETVTRARALPPDETIDPVALQTLISENVSIVTKALSAQLVVPDWEQFCNTLTNIFEEIKPNSGGENAQYIPGLAEVDPELFAVSVCTVDGQCFNIGDSDYQFCAQSCTKPITYLMAIHENGSKEVHRRVGKEPSGSSFNKLTLKTVQTDDGEEVQIPHNPMINAGAIMCCSMIGLGKTHAERFQSVQSTFRRLCGGTKIGFSNSTYLSERTTADRNFCLAYMMQEAKAFPPKTDLVSMLEFYFQTCSLELTSTQTSIMAATMANGGICPLTNDAIFDSGPVRNCLSLMLSCGMYDYSGEWAFSIGLPAKSGVGG